MLLENKVAVVTGVAYPTSKFAVNGFTRPLPGNLTPKASGSMPLPRHYRDRHDESCAQGDP